MPKASCGSRRCRTCAGPGSVLLRAVDLALEVDPIAVRPAEALDLPGVGGPGRAAEDVEVDRLLLADLGEDVDDEADALFGDQPAHDDESVLALVPGEPGRRDRRRADRRPSEATPNLSLSRPRVHSELATVRFLFQPSPGSPGEGPGQAQVERPAGGGRVEGPAGRAAPGVELAAEVVVEGEIGDHLDPGNAEIHDVVGGDHDVEIAGVAAAVAGQPDAPEGVEPRPQARRDGQGPDIDPALVDRRAAASIEGRDVGTAHRDQGHPVIVLQGLERPHGAGLRAAAGKELRVDDGDARCHRPPSVPAASAGAAARRSRSEPGDEGPLFAVEKPEVGRRGEGEERRPRRPTGRSRGRR